MGFEVGSRAPAQESLACETHTAAASFWNKQSGPQLEVSRVKHSTLPPQTHDTAWGSETTRALHTRCYALTHLSTATEAAHSYFNLKAEEVASGRTANARAGKPKSDPVLSLVWSHCACLGPSMVQLKGSHLTSPPFPIFKGEEGWAHLQSLSEPALCFCIYSRVVYSETGRIKCFPRCPADTPRLRRTSHFPL